ncbi:hypothetical protein SG34_017850 [Thalassomonas viridans]|uniref:Uncharacterized protein n=1 Tax=Thalassomonas viridans TaxID=137584 RepID=A0AAF0C7E3_9GAMM|nr:hypothetical protein [Thalassomonas viridans]WDE03256.1 hypothetical protein SG34_017850 [Thalassomonas viridans]
MKYLTSGFILFLSLPLVSGILAAMETRNLVDNIPLTADARVFARFDDSLPVVVNYFTRESEQAIIALYQESYGKPSARERKRGRLTVSFIRENSDIRIVISEQDRQRQVDILKIK